MQTLRNANGRQSSVLLALQRMEMFMLHFEHISLNRRNREIVTGKIMYVKFFTIVGEVRGLVAYKSPNLTKSRALYISHVLKEL